MLYPAELRALTGRVDGRDGSREGETGLEARQGGNFYRQIPSSASPWFPVRIYAPARPPVEAVDGAEKRSALVDRPVRQFKHEGGALFGVGELQAAPVHGGKLLRDRQSQPSAALAR